MESLYALNVLYHQGGPLRGCFIPLKRNCNGPSIDLIFLSLLRLWSLLVNMSKSDKSRRFKTRFAWSRVWALAKAPVTRGSWGRTLTHMARGKNRYKRGIPSVIEKYQMFSKEGELSSVNSMSPGFKTLKRVDDRTRLTRCLEIITAYAPSYIQVPSTLITEWLLPTRIKVFPIYRLSLYRPLGFNFPA